MSDRSVKVTLTLAAGQYQAELEKAKKSTEGLGKSTEGIGDKGAGALSKLATSARENREAWSTAGGALLTFGAAVTGVGIAALNTGIQYNTLQQTTRAALTSLLGSAEQANAQMDKLDAFARTSPFSKATFITAQQQMLAFGIETQKVVPYLDAVQNAVAAAGGSNQDIEEIVATMSKIQSSAKVTAEDLNEFGGRGVNAAEIIGSQMGKTGAQIRDDITSGSLDATVALDALTAGMSEKFAGAADGVKNTFAGSMDRIKAAWRDLSADLAEPLVGAQGGGLLVDLNNDIADTMRSFQQLPEPVKIATTAIAGITGVAALAAGSFLTLAPRILDTWTALGNLGRVGAGAQAALRGVGTAATMMWGPVGLAVAAIIAAVAALDQLSKKQVESFTAEQYTKGLLDVRDAAFTSVEALDEFFTISAGGFRGFNATHEVEDFAGALDLLFNTSGSDRVRDAMSWLPLIDNADFRSAREGLEGLDGALAGLVTSGSAETAAEAWDLIVSNAADLGIGVDELIEKFPVYSAALTDAENQQRLLAGETAVVTEATKEAQKALEEWAKAAGSAGDSFGNSLSAYDTVIEKNKTAAQEMADAHNEAAGDSEKSWEDFYDGTSVSMDEWIAELQAQRVATEQWAANYATALEQVRTEVPEAGRSASLEFIKEMTLAGESGAAALQTFVDGTPEQRQQLVDAFMGTDAAIATVIGTPTFEVEANMAEAESTIANWQATMVGTRTDLPVGADTTSGEGTVTSWLDILRSTITKTQVDADDNPARTTVKGTVDWVALQNPFITTGANDLTARTQVNTLTTWVGQQSPSVTVKAETSGFWGSILSSITGKSVTVPARATGAGPSAASRQHDGSILSTMPRLGPVAQFVPPGTPRVIGDRMKHDEAYIPLDGSERSHAILREANGRMPGWKAMAAGAIATTSGAAPAYYQQPASAPQYASVAMPSTLNVVDVDGALITRLRVEADGAIERMAMTIEREERHARRGGL